MAIFGNYELGAMISSEGDTNEASPKQKRKWSGTHAGIF